MFDQLTVHEFTGQYPVYFTRVIAIALNVTSDDSFQTGSVQIWPVASAGIEKDFLYVFRQLVSVPQTEMIKFVPTEE